MVSGVSAYQQQITISQTSTGTPVRQTEDRNAAIRAREDERSRDDSVTIGSRAERTTRSEEITATRDTQRNSDEQRRQAIATTSTGESGVAGKDSAQRRGSLLDISV